MPIDERKEEFKSKREMQVNLETTLVSWRDYKRRYLGKVEYLTVTKHKVVPVYSQIACYAELQVIRVRFI